MPLYFYETTTLYAKKWKENKIKKKTTSKVKSIPIIQTLWAWWNLAHKIYAHWQLV